MPTDQINAAENWAIEYIKKLEILFREEHQNPFDEDLTFYLDLFVDDWSLDGVSIKNEACEVLIELASSGNNRGAYDAAVFIATIELDAGNHLPKPTARFVANCLNGRVKRPPFEKGKIRDAKVLRDYTVLDMLDHLEKHFELGARTRNEATERVSPHDIVITAFEENDIPLTLKDVKNIDSNQPLKARWASSKDNQNLTPEERRLLIERLRNHSRP